MGCAPIGGSASQQSSGPVPTGKWETRWGASVEDESATSRGVVGATGVDESRQSKREAISVATEQCKKGGDRSVSFGSPISISVLRSQILPAELPEAAQVVLRTAQVASRRPRILHWQSAKTITD